MNGMQSTLMKAIANEQLEGLPQQEKLRTVFVRHDLQASNEYIHTIDFIITHPKLKMYGRTIEAIKFLTDLRFTKNLQDKTLTSLSGGWKMKVELVTAALMDADILLLDGNYPLNLYLR
jgi:elongation factor 3